MTIQPLTPAFGPNFFAISDPAEKRAISAFSKLKSSTELTFSILSSPKDTSLPTEDLEARANIFFTGNFLSNKV